MTADLFVQDILAFNLSKQRGLCTVSFYKHAESLNPVKHKICHLHVSTLPPVFAFPRYNPSHAMKPSSGAQLVTYIFISSRT